MSLPDADTWARLMADPDFVKSLIRPMGNHIMELYQQEFKPDFDMDKKFRRAEETMQLAEKYRRKIGGAPRATPDTAISYICKTDGCENTHVTHEFYDGFCAECESNRRRLARRMKEAPVADFKGAFS